MLQAAKRAGAAAESRPDRHAATGSARSVGPTGHAGLEPRPMVTPSLPQPVLEHREDRVTALTMVVAFVRARRPCLAAPGAVSGDGTVASSRGAMQPPATTTQVPRGCGWYRWIADGRSCGSPPGLPHLPPYLPPHHDVEALQQAKLPVSVAVNGPIGSATGVHCSARGPSTTAR